MLHLITTTEQREEEQERARAIADLLNRAQKLAETLPDYPIKSSMLDYISDAEFCATELASGSHE